MTMEKKDSNQDEAARIVQRSQDEGRLSPQEIRQLKESQSEQAEVLKQIYPSLKIR